jgi:hypothetical protein
VVINADGTLTYTPAPEFHGTDSFTYTVLDKDGSVSQLATVTVTVSAVNNLPDNQTMFRQDTLVFSAANGNAITVSALNANPAVDLFQVTLSVSGGSLVLGSTSGLASVSGSTSSITMSGTLNALNAALNGLSYTPPNPGFTGAVTFTMQTTNLDANGNPGPLFDNDSLTINVSKRN